MPPIDAALPELQAVLRARNAAVLVAPPGAGKTTCVPVALLDEPWMNGGKVIVLAPRRLAARAAAARMASLRGEPVGETIGYRVRLDSRVGPRTRVEMVTEGVFTRMILADPSLAGVAAVIFDEFHERSLEGDLALALALDAQAGLREDLRLLVMSATLDAAAVAALMGAVPVVQAEGRRFPILTRYRGRSAAPIDEAAAAAILAALRAEDGGVLCFLPGAREIERAARALAQTVRDPDVEIFTLYGAMTPAAQDRAASPPAPGKRKVVLASAIAETSLTLEGIRVVIDSGLTRRAKYEPATGLTRLETMRVSQAAAEQRRGRAGRTQPGVCWRLWDEGETRALIPFDPPEILEADLSGLAMDLAAWGVIDPGRLAWLDPPPTPAWRSALTLLDACGARDRDGRLTAHGAALAALPLAPRLAHMVVLAAGDGRARLAARLALLVSEQGLGGRDIDARERLNQWAADDGARSRSASGLADRIARAAGASAGETIEADAAGAVLAYAFPERVAKARAGLRGDFLLANGRGAGIEPTDPLARCEFLVVADLAGRAERAAIRLAAPLDSAAVERLFADRIETGESVSIDRASGAARAQRTRTLGAIVLTVTPLERPGGALLAAAILDLAAREGVGALAWGEEERQFRARVAFLRSLEGDDQWPDLSDAALAARLTDWLAPALAGINALGDQADGRLHRALEGLLNHDQRRGLAHRAPTSLRTPAGGAAPIDYTQSAGPTVRVRLQEMFGMAAHPTLAGGRAAVIVVLLSPARRAIQTTADLPGFWRGSYAGVRAEMRGRYPKHPWPENPLAAEPTTRAKPRSK